jgi:hypothetical protein
MYAPPRRLARVPAADAVRADVLKTYTRDPAGLVTRARFGTPAKAS